MKLITKMILQELFPKKVKHGPKALKSLKDCQCGDERKGAPTKRTR